MRGQDAVHQSVDVVVAMLLPLDCCSGSFFGPPQFHGHQHTHAIAPLLHCHAAPRSSKLFTVGQASAANPWPPPERDPACNDDVRVSIAGHRRRCTTSSARERIPGPCTSALHIICSLTGGSSCPPLAPLSKPIPAPFPRTRDWFRWILLGEQSSWRFETPRPCFFGT